MTDKRFPKTAQVARCMGSIVDLTGFAIVNDVPMLECGFLGEYTASFMSSVDDLEPLTEVAEEMLAYARRLEMRQAPEGFLSMYELRRLADAR